MSAMQIARRGSFLGCLVFLALFCSPAWADFELERADCSITVELKPPSAAMPEALLRRWVDSAARAVAAYYGRVPMKKAVVKLTIVPGKGVHFAEASEENGYGLIEVPVGAQTTWSQFERDWQLTHEMMHLGFPLQTGDYRWLPEGIATYAEPIARHRIGLLSAEEVWGDLLDNLPRGLQNCKNGLDNTDTIDGIYWGGALYCLLADIEIYKRTNGNSRLETVLRQILKDGGNIASGWSLEQTFSHASRHDGGVVLRELYQKMGRHQPKVDLESLWASLGVERRGRAIIFDDKAPLARIRKAIGGDR